MSCGCLFLCNYWFLCSCGWLLCRCLDWGAFFLLWCLLCGLSCLWLSWSFLLDGLGLILFTISCLLNGCGFSLGSSVGGGRLFNFGGLDLGCFSRSLSHLFSLCGLDLFFCGRLGSIGYWSLILGGCALSNLSFWLCLCGWLDLFRGCCLLLNLWLFSGRCLSLSDNGVLNRS